MATISSHVLDSVVGTHASGIRVECVRRLPSGKQQSLFNINANQDGRISETIEFQQSDEDAEIDLVFHSGDYYADSILPDDGFQILQVVVVRLKLPDPDATYHVPIMLAPHSYSIWWSGAARNP